MANKLNAENNYYFGIGNRVNSSIEMFPKEQLIRIDFSDGSHYDGYYKEEYKFKSIEKAHQFCNRVVKDMIKASRSNSVVNFSYYNNINKKWYGLEFKDSNF